MKYSIRIITKTGQQFLTNVDNLDFNYKKFNFNSKKPFCILGKPSFYINPKAIESITITEKEE